MAIFEDFHFNTTAELAELSTEIAELSTAENTEIAIFDKKWHQKIASFDKMSKKIYKNRGNHVAGVHHAAVCAVVKQTSWNLTRTGNSTLRIQWCINKFAHYRHIPSRKPKLKQ